MEPDAMEQDIGVLGLATRVERGLRGLGVETVRDLLEHYPRGDAYREVGAPVELDDARVGQAVTITGVVDRWTTAYPRKNLRIATLLLAEDGGGQVEAPFFNQVWRTRATPQGSRVAVSGTLERFGRKLRIKGARLVELAEGEHLGEDTPSVIATYPASEALPSHRIAATVADVLDRLPELPDHLPPELRLRHGLVDLDTAIRDVHRPSDAADAERARRRLVYDELLTLQIGLQQRRRRLSEDAVGLEQEPVPLGLAARFVDGLPFAPTRAQRRAVDELGADLGRPTPMHRLLQGEVGSGKTLIAAWAMLTALDHGRQAVLMAPTEVLAEQHARTFSRLLAPVGLDVPGGPRLGILTGSTPAKQRRGLLAELAVGDVQLLIGTHAVLEDVVRFDDLGLVVVDEQHRFGVEHRTRLRDKRTDDRTPDVLVMTATPIPRSLALTVYGDLDVTVLDELPPGRQPISTRVIPKESERRARVHGFVRDRVEAGERAYVVTPLVEPSDALEGVASAIEVHRQLGRHVFPDLSVGLVHGRLSSAQRDDVMERFRHGEIQVLVATTVIEVGVDVPEATVMVIEDAERFGISQLHQLRGRVGRGPQRSYCVLFSGSQGPNERLEAVAGTTDGFALAEKDLALRGEGSLFDTRQSGLPDLKLASLSRDAKVVGATRDDARDLVAADPHLAAHPRLAEEVRRRYGDDRLAALETG